MHFMDLCVFIPPMLLHDPVAICTYSCSSHLHSNPYIYKYIYYDMECPLRVRQAGAGGCHRTMKGYAHMIVMDVVFSSFIHTYLSLWLSHLSSLYKYMYILMILCCSSQALLHFTLCNGFIVFVSIFIRIFHAFIVLYLMRTYISMRACDMQHFTINKNNGSVFFLFCISLSLSHIKTLFHFEQ